MADPKTIKISTLAEFTKHTELHVEKAIATGSIFQGHWYRGIGSVAHTLVPSLFRHPNLRNIEELITIEAKMLEDFRRQGVLMPSELAVHGDDNDLRALFYMQHYSVPTRLLDWSNNPFIALYFALTSAHPDNSPAGYSHDAAVWVLNPVKWNAIALEHSSHGDAGALSSRDAVKGYGPRKLFVGDRLEPTAMTTLNEQCACCVGIANNARMFAQRGVFTIFGRETGSMEEQFRKFKHASESLIKFIIPKEKIGALLKLLLHLGYTDSVSYPDMHGLAMEIKTLARL
ncbi:FRG domain-containing protein [Variovorax sp. dw_954]|uniref:FRG domain-containing protein n=1 Tax=Variovorax sp. dw_954 TaxID=2720078 RepID=UPI001BD66B4C|nr:FRG domain-containing protein [Variovorax sp. dw_954]